MAADESNVAAQPQDAADKKSTVREVAKSTGLQLPEWAEQLADTYESHASSQFILHGNVADRILLQESDGGGAELGAVDEFIEKKLLSTFDVIFSYDLGNGLRNEKGKEIVSDWSGSGNLPRKPLDAFDRITHYLRYVTNLRHLGRDSAQVAIIIKAAHLILPAGASGTQYDLNAMALLAKEWSTDTALNAHQIATFFLCENINDLHPLLRSNPRATHVRVPLPSLAEVEGVLSHLQHECSGALSEYTDLAEPAGQLVGATVSSIEAMLRKRDYLNDPIIADDLAELKQKLVEKDCDGLIEFVEPDRSLADVYGHDAVKEWMLADIKLWQQGDLKAMPMGYLLCGPVGTGKTYLVECLAGEAGVPVVKLKNFRDRWVGSTEGNLEKIFRLLEALGRCIVFIDEADQALGKRNTQGDSGVSGRVYSMMAKQMSDTRNRGKIIWILASSRPDLIEIDLKRPGRVDVKFPLFPAYTPEGGYALIRALCRKQGMKISKKPDIDILKVIPDLVTAGAAEALSVRVYRLVKTKGLSVEEALRDCLDDYQSPIPEDIMRFQIDIAAQETTDVAFIPNHFREMLSEYD